LRQCERRALRLAPKAQGNARVRTSTLSSPSNRTPKVPDMQEKCCQSDNVMEAVGALWN
jgi:hypothetical protein